jgi:Endonuclease-reverse transcriptase
VGGGTGFLVHEPCKLLSSLSATFKSVELSTLEIKPPRTNLALYNIYRPPQSTAKSRLSSSFSQFLEDLRTLISIVPTSPHEFVITGDFNIRVDDPFESNAIQFLSLLYHANLIQHVKFPTHQHSHTLDLVIKSATSTLSPILTCLPVCPTDHFQIICSFNVIPPPRAPIIKFCTRVHVC